MHDLSFDEAVSQSIDIVRRMEDDRLAPSLVGAVLSYILEMHYEEEDHERILKFITKGTRDYIRKRQNTQEIGNA